MGFVKNEKHLVILTQQPKEVKPGHIPPGIFQLRICNHKVIIRFRGDIALFEYFLKNILFRSPENHFVLILIAFHKFHLELFGILLSRRPDLVMGIWLFFFNDVVEINHRRSGVHHQWASVFNTKSLAVTIHVTEQRISICKEDRNIA